MSADHRAQVLEMLHQLQLSHALFAHPYSVNWLTGFVEPATMGPALFSGGPSFVWVEDETFTLVVQDGHAGMVGSAFTGADHCRVLTYEGYTIQQPIHARAALLDILQALLGTSANGKKLGVEGHAVPGVWYNAITQGAWEVVPLDDALLPLRRVKDAAELAHIRRAIALTDVAQAAARAACRVGETEIGVWNAAQSALNAAAGKPMLLGNDCVIGSRAPNNVGGLPAEHVLRADSSLIVDLSTIVEGYWSDSCATYYPVEPTPRQQALHRLAAEALDFAISLIKPGAVAREIDAAVRDFMRQHNQPVYPHHTGHGIGLAGHEAPRITPYNEERLLVGEVIMLEPGIYYPGETSVRLEHAVLVTPDGAQILTNHL